MIGGAGDDTYYVDNARDVVVEAAGGGTDTVISSIAFTLKDSQVENLRLTGNANLAATGSDYSNVLYGNDGNNQLNGLAGADMLIGGKGDDIYFVDNVGDRIVEAANEGSEIVYSSVDLSLGEQHVEKIALSGSNNLNATGSSFNEKIVGNTGSNELHGNAGNDVLVGGFGRDALYGDASGADYADTFVFDNTPGGTNVDLIMDFDDLDSIDLAIGVYKFAGPVGMLAEKAFSIGSNSTSADTRILYDQSLSKLYYDADGSGIGSKVLVADIYDHAPISYDDIFII
jgi:Ca2+-binding RTX toxin-like protein